MRIVARNDVPTSSEQFHGFPATQKGRFVDGTPFCGFPATQKGRFVDGTSFCGFPATQKDRFVAGKRNSAAR